MTRNEGFGSLDSLHQSGDFGRQNAEINEKNDEFVSRSVKPFNNNPPLSPT